MKTLPPTVFSSRATYRNHKELGNFTPPRALRQFKCACLLTTCFPVPTAFFEEGWSVKHLSGRCREDQISSRPVKQFVMKACGDHSGILSPKNSTPRHLTSDEPDVVAIPNVTKVWPFVTFFVTIVGRCLWYDGRG